MQRRRKQYLKAGLLLSAVFVLVVAVSYTLPGSPAYSGGAKKGTYRVTSEVAGETTNIEGYVFFEISEPEMGGYSPPVFKLHFISPEDSDGRGIGFMIPLGADRTPIGVEEYRVASADKSFLNPSESVYGYADLAGSEGSLFLTESGGISIRHVSEREVAWDMDLMLKDHSGQRMRLEGSFHARLLQSSSGRFQATF